MSLDEEGDQGGPAPTSPPCQPESYVPVSMRMDVWMLAESEEAHERSPSTRVVIQIGGPSMARRTVHRSAITGRFVGPASAARWPGKTTTERVGSGTGNSRTVTRSAVTGRFVPGWRGDADPTGTIRQRV